MKTIKIGTRASKLAMAQAAIVARAITEYDANIATELVPITTTGDKILHKTLDKIGGKGLFVKELDTALLNGQVDITVHSCKDLPMQLDERLPVVAVSKREDPRDVLVLPQGVSSLDLTKPIGCSSARRRIQLGALCPDATVKSVRGNIITRLEKLDSGEYSALVLAAAGLKRVDLQDRISRYFTVEEMMPAACQGVLAVQACRGEDIGWLDLFKDEDSMRCVLAERAFVRALDGGCSKPCAAYAVLRQGAIHLQGMYVSDDESIVTRKGITIALDEIEIQAAQLAERMKADGQG